MAVGRADESLAEAMRVLKLDPLDPIRNAHLRWTYLMMRPYDEAIERERPALELHPVWT